MINFKRPIYTLLLFSLSFHALGKLPGRGDLSGINSDKSSRRKPQQRKQKGIDTGGGTGKSCGIPGLNDPISYDHLLVGAINPEIKIEGSPENGTFTLSIGRHIKACSKFEIKGKQVGNNVFLIAKNKYQEFTKEDRRGKSNEEIYTNCLDRKELLTDSGDIDWEKAERLGEISSGIKFPAIGFDLPADQKESVKLFFTSSESPSSDNPSTAVRPNPSLDLDCAYFEDFGRKAADDKKVSSKTKPFFIYKGTKDQIYDDAYNVCKNGSIEDVLKELSTLRKSHAGNFIDLERVLETTAQSLIEKEAEEIYDEIKDIEKILGKRKVDSDIIEENAKKYRTLVERLQKNVLTPLSKDLERLVKLKKKDRPKNYEKQVKELRSKLKKFYNSTTAGKEKSKGITSKLKLVYDRLRDEGKSNAARAIEKTRALSFQYSRIGTKRKGKKITIKSSKKDAKRHIAEFDERVLTDWDCHYESRRGESACIKNTQDDIQRVTRQYQRHQSEYQTFLRDGQRNCSQSPFGTGVVNSTRCRRFQEEYESRTRALHTVRARTGNYVTSRNNEINRYASNVSSFLAERSREDARSSDFSGFAQFSNDFNDSRTGDSLLDPLIFQTSQSRGSQLQQLSGGRFPSQNQQFQQFPGQQQQFSAGFSNPALTGTAPSFNFNPAFQQQTPGFSPFGQQQLLPQGSTQLQFQQPFIPGQQIQTGTFFR